MNIIITGATGFIGRAILQDLLKKNYNILAISRKKKLPTHKNITWLNSDISKISKYAGKVISFKPDVLIHLSWDKIPDFSKKNSNLNLKN